VSICITEGKHVVKADMNVMLCRLFKESPHPDEKQRQQLSKQLGLAPRQVKFWFQNRRTQIKVISLNLFIHLLTKPVDSSPFFS